MLILTAIALSAVAYWAFVTKPVKDEQEKEKRNQDSEAAAERAKARAEQDDYCSLFNEHPISNN